ncbi:MAG: DNA-processing protein DprA [Lachnospiraceae bacterium]|nr:DNA-processing protein DprA [Lachnospiraceae bacterium]
MTDKEYWLYFASIKGLEPARRNLLLETLGSPEEIYKAPERVLRGIPLLEEHHISRILAERNVDFETEAERINDLGIHFISSDDKGFPERLKCIPDAPKFLFYKGELPKDTVPAVAVIGSRKCSFYGREMCLDFSGRLAAAGIIIVSGMASGVDGFAHRGALNAKGKTIAVLGCGVDVCYPTMNRDIYDRICEGNGSIISEYYPGEAPLPYYFPLRNRIISGFADVLLVVEARKKSGTFITVDHALEQGKEIFAIPGRIGDTISDGCNSLIKNGAHLAAGPEDIIEELKVKYESLIRAEKSRKKKKEIMPEGEAGRVYECLSYHPVQINEISEKTGIPCGQLSSILIELEMKELIEEVGKNIYIRRK